MTRKTTITTILTALLVCVSAVAPLSASAVRKASAKSGAKTSQTAKPSKTSKTSKSAKSSKSTKKKGGSSRQGKTSSSADVRRQQEAVQQEIRLTQQQIKENDAAVKKNLTELGKLEGDIAAGKKRVADASVKVQTLKNNIGTLQQQIAADEKSLQKLRAEYLKAVKKMRAKRSDRSVLAFVMSSENFNQALRRIRYLRQFSDWRDRKSSEIEGRVASLRQQTNRLAQTKVQHDKALAESVKAQQQLQTEYDRQDAIVVDLRKNGQALHAHLSKKQQEVNALKNRVASLIAEEQRKAEADRLAREKAEAQRQARLQAEAKARADAEAHAQAEAEALARKQAQAQAAQAKAEKEQAARDAELLAQNEKPKPAKARKAPKAVSKPAPEKKEKPQKEQPKKEQAKKETKKENKKETKKREVETVEKSGDISYAEARRRRPRSGAQKPSTATSASHASAPSPSPAKPKPAAATSDFAGMKGSLPRPVAGAFKVTSRFGRHSLPDMPDVMFDNPGIDAEVSSGASAQAVYAGRVSGVYMVPGYSTVVIVNHGVYYTVYGNIASAAVKVGDNVRQGQSLGRLEPEEGDPSHSSIHFEVWKNRDKLDPLGWIR